MKGYMFTVQKTSPPLWCRGSNSISRWIQVSRSAKDGAAIIQIVNSGRHLCTLQTSNQGLVPYFSKVVKELSKIAIF